MPSRRFGPVCGCAVLVPCSRAGIVLITHPWSCRQSRSGRRSARQFPLSAIGSFTSSEVEHPRLLARVMDEEVGQAGPVGHRCRASGTISAPDVHHHTIAPRAQRRRPTAQITGPAELDQVCRAQSQTYPSRRVEAADLLNHGVDLSAHRRVLLIKCKGRPGRAVDDRGINGRTDVAMPHDLRGHPHR
jgi:hypothetical protein